MPLIHSYCRAVPSQLWLTVILCGFGFCGAVASDSLPATGPTHQITTSTRRIDLLDAESVLLEYPDWLTTVKCMDPSVIRVVAMRPNCLRLQRVGQGAAKLHAVDRQDQQYVLEVIVPALANVR